MKKTGSIVLIAGAALVLGILAERARVVPSIAPTPAQAQSATEGIQALKSQSQAFVAIAKEVLPSVVSITSNKVISPASGGGNGPFSDRFFHRFFDENPEEFRQQGSGSGVIVSEDGYILTNNHVVENADDLEVVLYDGRHFPAQLVGTDAASDVAVIRIQAKDLEPARLGNSDDLQVGEWVLAAGNPFQLSSSITSGIVSAIGRSGIGLTRYENFIQTDAAINPGNSGGALVNLDGEVIGINTAIATRSGGYQGIGFAIPINMARTNMDQLIKTGRVTRGFLGVNIGDIDETMADYYGLDAAHGAIVNRVTEDSPAEHAGIAQGDVIVALNGKPIDGVSDLQMQVAAISPGTKVDLEVVRDRRHKTVTAELAELPTDDGSDATPSQVKPEDDLFSKLGMTLDDVTGNTRREYELPDDVDGAVVTQVKALGAAGRANFRVGDVILKVDDTEVRSLRDLRDALSGIEEGAPVLFLVQRGDVELHLALRMPKE
ncbi:MAG: DegQ family serine endoprotease [Candidatus Eisenbacteria bacterium]|uniref:DegQ family serine endoprotease n=1 Tax=Eiseniibacteriota bacterium TaxID=2212470 RepID=A0A956LXV8_UNCEI|nr:DegQ family serine endoprotease [Candidatus Eisenbacteria bacterium]